MSSSNAWLLACSDTLTVAVSDHEIVECVQPERYYGIPGTPNYCSTVIAWQDKLVPVMDLAAALGGANNTPRDKAFVCLLSFQIAPKQPLQYLALRINGSPQKILVEDEQVCDAPAEGFSQLLKSATLCCFSHQQLPVAILDVARLSSEEFRELAQARPNSLAHDLPAVEFAQINSG
jgi:chemotaxis signal transduction protein